MGKQRGFTLIEMAIVLLIIGILMGIIMQAIMNTLSAGKQHETINKMDAVQQAIVNYVAVNRRLPCPADGAIASGVANAGVERGNPANGICNPPNQRTGVLPWVTLGLTEPEATDAWGVRFTYRVFSGAAGVARTDSLNMTDCDPAGGAIANTGPPIACNPGCSLATLASCTRPLNFLTNNSAPLGRGLQINRSNVAADVVINPATGNGAAYVLISHGANHGSGYSSTGTLQRDAPRNGSNEFQINRNGIGIRNPPLYYIDAPTNDDTVNIAAHFDDIVRYATIMQLATDAGLGPRAHQ